MIGRYHENTVRSLLLRLAVVLIGLLILLASLALLYVLIQTLRQFGAAITLFILGALVAYILNPAVNRAGAMLGRRWAGMLAVYLGFAVFLVVLMVLLVQPLLSQSSELISSVNGPSQASLSGLGAVQSRASQVQAELQTEKATIATGGTVSPARMTNVQAQIATLRREVAALRDERAVPASAPVKPGHTAPPQPQISIPPSYLAPLDASVVTLQSAYAQVVQQSPHPTLARVTRAVSAATGVVSAAAALHRTVSATPVIVLDAQAWMDQHGFNINVHTWVGQIVTKITSQTSSILSNTASTLSAAGNLLVNGMLILLISLYFVSDGARMIRRGLDLVPDRYRRQATFFVQSVDTVLGQSIRANILCAAIAGVLGGLGALVLGVPYAVLIGVSTFVLQLVPIIGAVVLVIPPAVIALLFTSPTKAIIIFVWYIVFEQIVTNVIGPRLTSKTVGIHPLEAMGAALVGYPIAGFLGSFFAVPTVGLMHVLVKQALAARKEKRMARAAPRATAAPVPALVAGEGQT